MALKLSQKEQMLLQDQKSHEEICIKKYNTYANQAQDPQLKQLFSSLAQQEQQHLNTINQILAGKVPSTNQQQGQQGQQSQPGGQAQAMAASGQGSGQQQGGSQTGGNAGQNQNVSQADANLCQDMLMTEKYVSGTYDTAIFEFTDSNVRQVLNHIQKEEQQHGEAIFKYMQSKGLYQVQ